MGVIGDVLSWAGIGLPAFLFVITVVVFFHELGHFLVGRACGVAVESFSIGFGRELIGFTDRKGTRWKLSLLPLGGYVKFAGDANAASAPDQEQLQAMDPATRSASLHFKPLWQRAAVVAAGPIANFILAIVIFTGVFMIAGTPSNDPVVGTVVPNSAAEAAGLQEGDVIQTVDGKPVTTFRDFATAVAASAGKPVRIEFDRGGNLMTVSATPRAVANGEGPRRTAYRLGLQSAREPMGPIAAGTIAVERTWFIVSQTMSYLGQMVTGYAKPDQLSGPIGIAKISGDVAAQGFLELMGLAGLLSVSIGLINLFPIPMLDGGHLLYYAFEAVRGRPLGERAQEMGFRIGLAFVLSLMLLATFNDLVRFNLF